MKIKAVVVREVNNLTVETVTLEPPSTGQVLVRMRAAGVCHSDLHTLRGELRATPPLVLGHEGAGTVEAVGPGVNRVKHGDRVIINWLPSCGRCRYCMEGHPNLCERLADTTFQGKLPDGTSHLRTDDGILLKHYLSSATMAEYAVVDEAGVIPIPDDVPFEVAAIIGCAVLTGVGAVLNTAQVRPGRSAAVIGCGGVGLSAIQGCRLAGCHPIIAVDIMDSKLDLARELGATDVINARRTDPVEELRKRTDGGPDYVFDSVGAATTIRQALEAVRPAGVAVIIGLHAGLQEIPIPPISLILFDKRLLGSFAGSSRPHVDLPRLVELYRAGLLDLDKLISKRYTLEEIERAFADMEAGNIARGVLMFD
ncbi:TPA: Zn-dependent alcohol dehydrogenase [Candidatus Poribacteria bacterium]|nr:Zn-dependent alcohol dehydrogenase [Candidatus Poribacteria bacterium]